MTAQPLAESPDELQAEFAALEDELVQAEMDLAALQADLDVFERRYLEQIGPRLARVDELRAAIAAAAGEKGSRTQRSALRQLYRKLARALHPDLATDEDDRAFRTAQMAEVNAAYAQGNRAKLEQMERELDSGRLTQPVLTMIHTWRIKIAQARRRIVEIREAREQLFSSPAGQLWTEGQEASSEGRDLLAEMATSLDAQIRDLEGELAMVREPE
jgi:hypothetical protein